MKAMLLTRIAPLSKIPDPLVLTDIECPEPGPHEVLIKVSACGVCHTELDEIEGRTPPPALPVVPGHEVTGRITSLGSAAKRHAQGDRVGVGWIFRSSGSALENLSDEFVATGRDVNGGYAEYMVVDERYAHPIPDFYNDVEAAPLLCAGSVGYRALKLAGISNGETLGLTGFGGSGHLVLVTSKHLYPDSPVFVFARSAAERQFALDLGADWAGDTADLPPHGSHAIIDTTPAWFPVVAALERLRPGGRLVINAIRKEEGDKGVLADIDYARHLWMEKSLQTVANVTGDDIAGFLKIAADAQIRPDVEVFALADANRALRQLRQGSIRGAKVLAVA